MAYNAVEMADWQISEAAEENMPYPEDWREKLALEKDEVLPMGRFCKLDFLKIIDRLKDKPDGKYIEVTAITPTPLGEGKSTTSCGLMEGMGKRGVNVGGCLRQPSGGPTMNVKGTAAGRGNSAIRFRASRGSSDLTPGSRPSWMRDGRWNSTWSRSSRTATSLGISRMTGTSTHSPSICTSTSDSKAEIYQRLKKLEKRKSGQ